ncbi:MAG: ribonucleotide reductase N-terminal alpha domain-containing protein, partial [Candidatus Cloacimonas sp.]|nr:ribonucleotide reductase N-terminal alpha domain-containing protein [Candidatus Cloacimonas sp.]
MKLTDNALKVLEKRYFRKDDQGKLIEDWHKMISRVANNIAGDDAETAQRFYQLLDSGYFLPNSPTLMN